MSKEIINELKCACCKTNYNENDIFCGTCGYPLRGTPEEQQQHRTKYAINKFEKEDSQAKVNEARVVLFLLGVFTVISGVIIHLQVQNTLILVINLILAAIYAGLGFWAKKKAFAAIFTGFLIYVAIILLNAIVEPMSIFRGIIFKVIFIIAFVKASYGAYKYKIGKE